MYNPQFYTDPAVQAAVNKRCEREHRLRVASAKRRSDPRPLEVRVADQMRLLSEGGEKSVLKEDLLLAGFTSAELTDRILASAFDLATAMLRRELA